MRRSRNVLIARKVRFLSAGDEARFFRGLERNGAVTSVQGLGTDVIIKLSGAALKRNELVELLALFYRYDVDMRQLARLVSGELQTHRGAYWYRRVFPRGKAPRRVMR